MTVVRFQPTQDDYVSASRANYLVRLRTWRGCGPLLIVALAAALGVNGADYLSTGRLDPFWLGWFGFAVVILPLAVGLNLLLIRRTVRRMFAEQPGYAEPMTVEWSEDGFVIDSPMTVHRMAWRHLVAWRDARREYLLYITRTGCLFVPKHVFDTQQAADFEQRLRGSGKHPGS